MFRISLSQFTSVDEYYKEFIQINSDINISILIISKTTLMLRLCNIPLYLVQQMQLQQTQHFGLCFVEEEQNKIFYQSEGGIQLQSK